MPSFPYCTRNLLVAIVGPTGAGKSELGLGIAEHLDGEIVNCDSMQIYRGFDIGTAKLPPSHRRGIPHHLLDFLDPEQGFSAGDYGRQARQTVAGIMARSKVPIIVGGTGFYLRALLDGLPNLPVRNERLRERLAKHSAPMLHRMLQRVDSAAAVRLHANDTVRIIRALEIRFLLGRPAPTLQTASALPDVSIRQIGLFPPRDALYRLLDERTESMFANGLIEELRGLLASGVPSSAKPLEAVGYRQALAVLEGRMSESQAIADTQRATRNYAKRQITWFRRDTRTLALRQFGYQADAGALAMRLANEETHPPPGSI